MPTEKSFLLAVKEYLLITIGIPKKAFVTQRVDALNTEVADAKADAVMFYTNIYEDSASWDYPSQKKSLDDQGIKNACFAKMLYPAEKNEDLAAKIAEFIKG